VMHPMDTGLVSGIPSFHLEELVLRDDQEQALARLEMHEPISENPLLTFELGTAVQGIIHLSGRDNNGNTFFQKVSA
jgi:sulfur-oxidizing protein SoxY